MRVPPSSLTTLALALLLAQGSSLAQAAPVEPTSSATAAPRELGKPEDDIELDVQAYQIDGLPGVPADKLAAVTAPFTGKARHFEDLSNAVAAVTLFVQRDLGYYVGMAYLPEQNPKNGIVHIQVMEGRLDQVKVNWSDDLPVKRDVIEAHLAAFKPGSVLRVDEVERAVLLLGDLPGVRTRFEIEPGRTPGTASLVVTPQAEARVAGSAEFDTLGSRYTGITRWGVQAAIASPLGWGDTLMLHARTTTSTGLYDGGLSYIVPVGAQGLKLGASLAGVSYQVDRSFFTQSLHGSALASNVFGTYPVIRSRNLNLFGLASVNYKRFDDQFDDFSTRKSSTGVQLGVLGDLRDGLLGGGINTYDAAWTQGRMSFDPALTPDGIRPSYGKLTLGASRLQNILPGRLQFYARYKGQLTNANLDATERLPLGGADGVRAFGPSEGTGDDAHLLSAELRLLPPESWFGRASRELAFRTFYDWGHSKYSHDPLPTGLVNTTTLAAVGLGLSWERPSEFALRFDLAWRAQGHADIEPPNHQPRASLVLNKPF